MALDISFDLPPEEALEWFRAKGLAVSYDWRDMLHEQHTLAFTVAKMADVDLLADVRSAVDRALAAGQTLPEFRAGLAPLLKNKGWWGKQEAMDPETGGIKQVQLGSPRRLRTIFETNLKTAYAAGHWDQIQRTKADFPYLMYDAIQDSATRPQRRGWDGTVLAADNPWWNTHYPPNGWNCRCGAIQVDDDLLAQMGKSGPDQAPPLRLEDWTNPRTGQVEQIPLGIDPGWAYHPGRDQKQALKRWMETRAATLPPDMAANVLAALQYKPQVLSPEESVARKTLVEEYFGSSTYNRYLTAASENVAQRPALGNAGLADDSLVGIYAYTGPDYKIMNTVYRISSAAGPAARSSLRPLVDAIEEGLGKLPAYTGWTMRRIPMTARELSAFTEGRIVKEQSFVSASRRWPRPGGNVFMHIYSKSGRMIEGVSKFPGQQEVLFRPGTYFKIDKVVPEGDTVRIYMIEV